MSSRKKSYPTMILSAAIAFFFILQEINGLSLKSTPTAKHTNIDNWQHPPGYSRRHVVQSVAALSLIGLPESAKSLSPQEASSAYDTYAGNYDSLDGGSASTMFGIDEARSSLFSQARGNVLEIGAGTGLNLEKYNPSQLSSLTLLDISEGMLSQAQKRISSLPSLSGVPIKFIRADATSELVSTFGAASFDTVVDSFSLCTMGNEGAQSCLSEISKVVKPNLDGGQVLLLENSRASNPLLGIYQDATAGAAADIGGKGCVYNQNVEGMIRSTKGMAIEQQDLYAAGLFRSFRCVVN